MCWAGNAHVRSTDILRDIRELTNDPEAYAAELRRRWGGLLSYRYIGRFHASMDNGVADETVTMRRDLRNPSGGLLLAVLGIASPDSGGVSDLEAVPNPVIWSCQVLDPGRDIKRFEKISGGHGFDENYAATVGAWIAADMNNLPSS